MALSAISALLIGLFHNSATESVLHYPRPQRPIIEQTFTTTNPQLRDLPDAPRIKKEEVPAKRDEPKKNINDSRVLFAKADVAKRKHETKTKCSRLSARSPKCWPVSATFMRGTMGTRWAMPKSTGHSAYFPIGELLRPISLAKM
jgi:hypothetical protein